MIDFQRAGECARCGECCRKTRITSLLGNIIRQHGNLEEAETYYSLRGIRIAGVHEASDRVFLEMDVACSQLTGDNRCALFESPEKRPLICHKYPWFRDDIKSCGFTFVKKGA